MLRPFFPELVMSTDLLSFEHPSVLLVSLSTVDYTIPTVDYTLLIVEYTLQTADYTDQYADYTL